MSDKVYILIPVFEAGLSTYEYVLEFINCIKNCKAVNTDFFQPLTDVIPFKSGYLTMSSVIGDSDTNKQWAMS